MLANSEINQTLEMISHLIKSTYGIFSLQKRLLSSDTATHAADPSHQS
jgi:hypothetical protein